jgi:hypothetical protein
MIFIADHPAAVAAIRSKPLIPVPARVESNGTG